MGGRREEKTGEMERERERERLMRGGWRCGMRWASRGDVQEDLQPPTITEHLAEEAVAVAMNALSWRWARCVHPAGTRTSV